MSNIKHLTIWEDSWGPRRLYDPERQTMCCMGMHCAADGVALDLMEEMSLPSEIGALLQHDMNEKVSAEHVEAVGGNDMTDKEDALAAVNDAYHGRGPGRLLSRLPPPPSPEEAPAPPLPRDAGHPADVSERCSSDPAGRAEVRTAARDLGRVGGRRVFGFLVYDGFDVQVGEFKSRCAADALRLAHDMVDDDSEILVLGREFYTINQYGKTIVYRPCPPWESPDTWCEWASSLDSSPFRDDAVIE